MLSKQIFKKHWINNIFLLIGLFLLISFFLPFTAEGALLAIQDCTCSGAGKTVTFEVSVKNYSGEIGYFGFNVKYDADILEYKNEANVDVEYLSVREHGGYLEIQGQGNIEGKETGRIAYLVFIVKKCEETTLELTNLSGDFWQWRTSNGSLIPSEKGGGSGYLGYSPFFLPGPTLYPQPLFPGYFPPAFNVLPGLNNSVSYPLFPEYVFPAYSGSPSLINSVSYPFFDYSKIYSSNTDFFPALRFDPYFPGMSFFPYSSFNDTWSWDF